VACDKSLESLVICHLERVEPPLRGRFGLRTGVFKKNNTGIAKAKNTCITLFLKSSASYLSFLLITMFVWWKAQGWQQAYEI
jgi:hypothetical protein